MWTTPRAPPHSSTKAMSKRVSMTDRKRINGHSANSALFAVTPEANKRRRDTGQTALRLLSFGQKTGQPNGRRGGI